MPCQWGSSTRWWACPWSGRGAGSPSSGLPPAPSATASTYSSRFPVPIRQLEGAQPGFEEKDRSKKIDYCSRFMFPMIFLTFNIFYWKSYLGETSIIPPA